MNNDIQSAENAKQDPYFAKKSLTVSVRDIYKMMSGKPILNDISFDMYSGEVLGFLGPNGSGKTTTIKIMLGLLKADSGDVVICGHKIRGDFEAAVANVGAIIENPELYKHLTGYQNLQQFARMYDNISKGRIDEVVSVVRLQGRINDKVSAYSLGMRQRLGIAQALLHRPRVLLLDEPTNGLDPAGIKELRDIFADITRNNDVSILVSSHMLAELELMCDRVAIIDRGSVISIRKMSELREKTDGQLPLYSISVDNPEKAGNILYSMGYTAKLCDGLIVVAFPADKAAGIIKALALADVGVTEFSPQHRTLEDAFMEVTDNYKIGGVGV